jgi:hypothetical protein
MDGSVSEAVHRLNGRCGSASIRHLGRTGAHVRRWSLIALLAVSACDSPVGGGPATDALAPAADAAPADAAPADAAALPEAPALAPTLNRLTQAQYRNTIRDLLGADVVQPPTLEPDAKADGLVAVGAASSTISSRGVEIYEQAALSLAEQVLATPERRARVLPCEPSGPGDAACMRQMVERFGRRAWRRPLTADEVESVAALGLASANGDFLTGARYALARLLQSPFFLYRVEVGGGERLDAYELATRLAFFLWNAGPDDALLDAAARGDLDTPEGLDREVDRLLADPRAREAVRNFFDEWLGLDELSTLRKDPNVFRHYASDLGQSAREETLRVAEHLVFEEQADLRELLRTRTTFVDRRLAAIYNVPATARGGFGRVELPPEGERRGLLGHVSFLAGRAHPTSSSATLRGIFVREALLCEDMPPPPANLNTAIPQPSPDARTLRERLQVHMLDPNCAGCHKLSDHIGLGLERFDGIGRARETDNDAPIDPAGELDGTPFADASSLADVLADDPRFPRCFARKMYSYALGRTPGRDELETVRAFGERFDARGRRVLDLVRDIATSEAFRTVAEIAE